MPAKLKYSYVKSRIEKEGYKLLSGEYKDVYSKLKLQCPEGHIISMNWESFRRGSRCNLCRIEKSRLDFSTVIKLFKDAGLELLSKKNEYINTSSKLKFKCKNGHYGEMSLDSIRQGNRCYQCSIVRRKTYNEIKKSIESEGYKLVSKEYKNSKSKLKLICPEGHKWQVSWNSWDKGARCFYCFHKETGELRRESIENVIDEFKNRGYELISKEYINSHEYLEYKCPNNHYGKMKYYLFKRGCGCPLCVKSNSEEEVADFLSGFSLLRGDRKIIKPLELDIVIPSKKTAIEYCGLYWHSHSVKKNKNYHLNKLQLCNKAGYRLITIFEDEWIHKRKLVESRILNILNNNEAKPLYARNCIVKEIDTKFKNKFLNKFHIQGADKSFIKIGLFYNNKIVSVMTFSKLSISKGNKNTKDCYELSRFCTDYNYRVIGAASKLLKYFFREYMPVNLISYADRRWSNGNLYYKLGFKFSHYTKPNYWYVDKHLIKRIHRFSFRKSVLKDKLDNFDNNLSEAENMINNGYDRIYDCGNIRFDWSCKQ